MPIQIEVQQLRALDAADVVRQCRALGWSSCVDAIERSADALRSEMRRDVNVTRLNQLFRSDAAAFEILLGTAFSGSPVEQQRGQLLLREMHSRDPTRKQAALVEIFDKLMRFVDTADVGELLVLGKVLSPFSASVKAAFDRVHSLVSLARAALRTAVRTGVVLMPAALIQACHVPEAPGDGSLPDRRLEIDFFIPEGPSKETIFDILAQGSRQFGEDALEAKKEAEDRKLAAYDAQQEKEEAEVDAVARNVCADLQDEVAAMRQGPFKNSSYDSMTSAKRIDFEQKRKRHVC